MRRSSRNPLAEPSRNEYSFRKPMTPVADRTRPTDKRDAIMTAALELFVERGFHGTAVPEIAERADVGAGTIYRYFESKEALVNELYRREKQALATRVLSQFPLDGS